jgi:glycosyltransferase involved in cell wall biosynthesis
MARISVIIPVFNDAPYLAEALDSALGQTRSPDEVIVIDDGSTDESFKVAQTFLPRITLLRQANQGISGGRNAGLGVATGDLIAFLDADDVWPNDSLEVRLERLLAEPGLDAVFGEITQFASPDMDEALRARLHVPIDQVAARFAGSMLMRRTLFDRVGLYDPQLKVGEMIDWTLRADDAGARMAAIPHLVMRRRIHGSNTMITERPSRGDYFKALRASLARKASQALAEPQS